MSDNLDAMFDGIVQALIEEHLEHRNKVQQKRMNDGEVEEMW
jgi:hypothetical protein